MSRPIEIIHYLQVNGTMESVFETVSTPKGISKWWSRKAKGHTELGALLDLDFGPDYQWQAQVTQMVAPNEIELTLTKADEDWLDSSVGFRLASGSKGVDVQFYHRGWKEPNEHYYISCYCWAMYLRIMKRYVEFGELVEYEDRLDV